MTQIKRFKTPLGEDDPRVEGSHVCSDDDDNKSGASLGRNECLDVGDHRFAVKKIRGVMNEHVK